METILVVENMPQVREMLGLYLKGIGYTILQASSCEEAMLRAKAYDENIHLLLTNIFLPGMTGHQLAAYFAAIQPGIKVIYISSSSYTDLIHDGIHIQEDTFFRKPFSLDIIADKIRELLGNRE